MHTVNILIILNGQPITPNNFVAKYLRFLSPKATFQTDSKITRDSLKSTCQVQKMTFMTAFCSIYLKIRQDSGKCSVFNSLHYAERFFRKRNRLPPMHSIPVKLSGNSQLTIAKLSIRLVYFWNCLDKTHMHECVDRQTSYEEILVRGY